MEMVKIINKNSKYGDGKDYEGSVPDKPLGSSDAQGFAPDFNRLKNRLQLHEKLNLQNIKFNNITSYQMHTMYSFTYFVLQNHFQLPILPLPLCLAIIILT